MRKLTCTSCGAGLVLATTKDGHVIGDCGNCGAQYVIEVQGRQHIILEHRFPDAKPQPSARSATRSSADRATGTASRQAAETGPSRRKMVFGGLGLAAAAGAGLGVASVLGLRLSGGAAPAGGGAVETVFNIGGQGAGAGLFRDGIFDIGIDSLSRAVIRDRQSRFYVFGPDGSPLNQFLSPVPAAGSMLGVLPAGDIVIETAGQLLRIDPLKGAITAQTAMPEHKGYWTNGAGHCVTADGGIALYVVEERDTDQPASLAGMDSLILLDRDLRERKRLSGLLGTAIAPDPLVTTPPMVTSIAINAAGSIFLAVKRNEETDSRDGIFEFNAEGVFQRRLETGAQETTRFAPQVTAAPDGRLWLSDPWDSKLHAVTPSGLQGVTPRSEGIGAETAIGNIMAVAAYPDGDLGVIGVGSARFARLRIKPPSLTAAASPTFPATGAAPSDATKA